MKIKLIRDLKNTLYTLGKVYIDDVFFCFTVEDVDRDSNQDGDLDDIGENKIHGQTAIPKGTYKMVLSMSNRFKKLMPEVLNVKGFSGIRWHSGNTALDTEGCVIVGTVRTPNGVGLSRQCFTKLMDKLKDQKDIILTIE